MGCCQRCLTPCKEPKVRDQTLGQKRRKGRRWTGEAEGDAGGERMQEEEEDGKDGRSSQRKDGFRRKDRCSRLEGGGE